MEEGFFLFQLDRVGFQIDILEEQLGVFFNASFTRTLDNVTQTSKEEDARTNPNVISCTYV